jgi:ornithine cyclodeaminase/alanine dehydrogenase
MALRGMPNPQSFLYLSRADVAATAIDAVMARDAIMSAFADARNTSLPKQTLQIGAGHAFQGMVAASPGQDVATVKWLGIASGAIHALICVNDFATGALLAVMDGDLITLTRTAAMSAAAAHFLAPPAPRVLGFIGCGAQAYAHLTAFRALYPSLERVAAYSRSSASAAALAAEAGRHGLAASVSADAEQAVRDSDILVTTVPASAGFVPFLDAGWLKANAFVSAVDVGRSWMPDRLDQFDAIATDSMVQTEAAPAADGNLVGKRFDFDLAGLATGTQTATAGGRMLFSFKGFALGDLALAKLVYDKAVRCRLGTLLDR